jgi:hypothetical protein
MYFFFMTQDVDEPVTPIHLMITHNFLQRSTEANIKQKLGQSLKITIYGTAVTNMKSPSQAQSTNNININSPITLSNSMLHTPRSLNADFPVFPADTMTRSASTESEAVRRERLLLILNAAMALAENAEAIFDSDPDETPQSHIGALG